MTRMTRQTVDASTRVGAGARGRTGIVHLGLGNFHRAHLAVYTALAGGGDWGIVGVANRSRTVVDAMTAQDHLYSVVTLDPAVQDVGVIDVHRRLLVAAEQPGDVLDVLADPGHRIISLTITEAGYHLDATTGELDLSSPGIADDLAARPAQGTLPSTMLGLLAYGLLRRHATGGAPVTVLSCDNLVANGDTVRRAVLGFCRAAGADAGADDAFFDWVERSVTFPNSMVDRIVPAPTETTRQTAQQVLGLEDQAAVPAERFTMWVLEDRFAAGRPTWETAGAVFSYEVGAYEMVKLRLLNAAHSLIAYLGGLDGRPTIPAARGEEFIERCTRVLLEQENLPSIDLPRGFNPKNYLEQLFDRWNNTVLGDLTSRVGSDGSTKLPQRIPAPSLRMLETGQIPRMNALTVAGWIACTVPPVGSDPGEVAAAMQEPRRESLQQAVADATSVREHVQAVLRTGVLPDELVAHTAFVDEVVTDLELIITEGVRAAAARALGE